MDNKYVKLHSLLRMLGALLAIVVFVSMFIAKQAVNTDYDFNFTFRNGAFFGDGAIKGNVLAFIGYLLVFIGGLAGLAFVFIDEILGKDLTKKLSFLVGVLAVLGAIAILTFSPLFRGINHFSLKYCHTGVAPIVFGVLGLCVGAIQIAAPILEDKGK